MLCTIRCRPCSEGFHEVLSREKSKCKSVFLTISLLLSSAVCVHVHPYECVSVGLEKEMEGCVK